MFDTNHGRKRGPDPHQLYLLERRYRVNPTTVASPVNIESPVQRFSLLMRIDELLKHCGHGNIVYYPTSLIVVDHETLCLSVFVSKI